MVVRLARTRARGSPRRTSAARVGVALASALSALVVVSAAHPAPAVASTNPLAWAPAVRIETHGPWSSPRGISAVACPSATFCAAVDGAGDVVISPDPTGGPGAWSTLTIDARNTELMSISCPSSGFCAAVDDAGNVFTSTAPTARAIAWTKAMIDSGLPLKGVSCPSASFCAAVDDAGSVLTSTDPTGGAGTWTKAVIAPPYDGVSLALLGPSCPSANFCAAVDWFGNVYTSSDPTGGVRSWKVSEVDPWAVGMENYLGPVAISCPSASLCAFVDAAGNVATSSDPSGGRPAWQIAKIATQPVSGGNTVEALGDISCATVRFCATIVVGATGYGTLAVSTEPTGGAGAWTRTAVDDGGSTSIQAISCPSANFCAAVDEVGNVLTSTDPRGGGAWTSAIIDTGSGQFGLGNRLTGVSCPSANFCAAVDEVGNVLTSTDPSAGSVAWTKSLIDSGVGLLGISCPSTSFCAAVDQDGGILTSTDPTGGAVEWTRTPIDATSNMLSTISCPSANFCAAADEVGNVFTSTDPTGGATTWAKVEVNLGGFSSISCPSANFCAAVGGALGGTLFASTDPTGDAKTWKAVDFPDYSVIVGVSCPSADVCAVVGFLYGFGILATVTDPTGASASWTVDEANMGEFAAGAINGVSCPLTNFCAAVDDDGNLFTAAQPPPPTVSAVTPSSGAEAGGTVVTITGSHFTVGAQVSFGATAATRTFIISPNEIRATSPAGIGAEDVTVTTVAGPSATSPADVFTYETVGYHGIAPVRICDTRQGQPANQCSGHGFGTGVTQVVTVAGLGGVPASGASAVVLNVTATDATATSYFTVFADGETRPLASSINFHAGQNVANLVTVALPHDGKVDIYNASGGVNLIVDVEGYDAPDVVAGTGLYNAVAPARICDTRRGLPANQCTGMAPTAGRTLDVQVTGRGGVPASGVGAAVLNVTAIDPVAPGYLTVYTQGSAKPVTSNLNYRADAAVLSEVIVPVSSEGLISIFVSSGPLDIAVVVSGWFTDTSNPNVKGAQFFLAHSPGRICDTRTGQMWNSCTGKALAAGGVLDVEATGIGGVPVDATAVLLNVTAVGSRTGGYVTVYPAGQQRPDVSDLDFGPGETVANMVIASLGLGGFFSIYNARGSTELIVDLVGWYS